jgi:hypothetical protein
MNPFRELATLMWSIRWISRQHQQGRGSRNVAVQQDSSIVYELNFRTMQGRKFLELLPSSCFYAIVVAAAAVVIRLYLLRLSLTAARRAATYWIAHASLLLRAFGISYCDSRPQFKRHGLFLLDVNFLQETSDSWQCVYHTASHPVRELQAEQL